MSINNVETLETAQPAVLNEVQHIDGPRGTECVLAHAVPGRIRFNMPSLKSGGLGVQPLRVHLKALEGVETARANPLTGSFIVVYDGAPRTRARIFAALEQLGYRLRAVQASTDRRNTSSTDAVAKALVCALVEHVFSLTLAVAI